MAEAYETQAFEEVYKHPNWKIEAETFENDFTMALYDDESVKKEGQAALVHVSNVLVTYNRIAEVSQAARDARSGDLASVKSSIETNAKHLAELNGKQELTDDEKKQKEQLEELQKIAKKELDKIEKEINEETAKGIEEVRNNDDDGQILSSLMLGGTGIGGQGYTITDNSIQDTRKGAKYIREQMTEKGTLLDQMALLDNAMNTGGIDLQKGTTIKPDEKTEEEKEKEKAEHSGIKGVFNSVKNFFTGDKPLDKEEYKFDFNTGENLQKKTLNDMFRETDEVNLGLLTSLTAQDGHQINIDEVKKFQKKGQEEKNALIGDEGLGQNREEIMDVASRREATAEAKLRKGGPKSTGIKGAFNSVKSYFTGTDNNWVGPLSQEEEAEKKKQEDAKKPKETGIKGVFNSVKNFFTGGDKPKPFEVDYGNLSDRHKYMLLRQGVDPDTVKDKWNMGLTDAQKRVLARIKYEQRKAKRDQAARDMGMFKASGNLNKADTAERVKGLMNDRDKAIARELNEKKFLTTADAEKISKDPKAANQEAKRIMNSSKSARNMLGMYKMLSKDEKSLFTFRLALLAYLVPTRRNTIYEVMAQSHEAGVTGKEDLSDPARMYETVSPLTKDEIRSKLPGKKQFPHEKVFMTLLDEYNEMRADARGTKKEDRRDLVVNQKNMTIAEVARELLNPASGLALFAKLRLLTDESITDDDIKKHIDRLDANEQNLVNEFMEKLAREQKISFEDLKQWLKDNEKEIQELDAQIEPKQKELTKVMKELMAREQESFGRRPDKTLDQKSRDLDNEIRSLSDKKEALAKERKEKEKDYNERVEWKNEREPQAITAVGKIRKDLFHLLTATPTAYETDLEATVPALRNRLLVITRLANRFLLDEFAEKPEGFEDKHKFKEYNPDREEVFQAQIKEEKAGTLGVSQATKDEQKRKEEEEKARIAAEKEARANISVRCMTMMDSVKEDEKLLPDGLENKKKVSVTEVAKAITRVINTYLNFDPSVIKNVSDAVFPDMIPRIKRYQLAAAQIQQLLAVRGDVNAALSEEQLQKVRHALALKESTDNYIEAKYAVFTNAAFQSMTGDEYEKKTREVREAKGEGEFSDDELHLAEKQIAAEKAAEQLGEAGEKEMPGLEDGHTYLHSMEDLLNDLEGAKDDKDPQYQEVIGNFKNLKDKLSQTFDANTDIPTGVGEVTEYFSMLEASCGEYLEAVKEKGKSPRKEKVAGVLARFGGMNLRFGQAAYRTVEILNNNHVLRKGKHLWARVMIIGEPKISKNVNLNVLSTRPQLETLSEDEKNNLLQVDKKDGDKTVKVSRYNYVDTATSPDDDFAGNKSLARYRRAFLGSKDLNETRKTLNTYKEWDAQDRQDKTILQDQLNELDKKEEPKVEEPQKEEPQKEEPKTAEKPLEEQEIDQILAEQEAANIEVKVGEENRILQWWQKCLNDLDKYKTGVLGLFADKQRNADIADIKQAIRELIPFLSETAPQLKIEDDKITNEAELQQAFQEKMHKVYVKADKVRSYVFVHTGTRQDEAADPFRAYCRKIHSWAALYKKVGRAMEEQSVMNVLQSNKGTDKKNNRQDLFSYAMKQAKEGKLRYLYFVLRGMMGTGEEPYAAPEKWLTKKQLMKEAAEKRAKLEQEQEKLEQEHKDDQKPIRFSINDTDSEDEEEESDLDKSHDELPHIHDDDEEEELDTKDEEAVNHALKNLEKEIEDGNYEDENGEQQVNEEQQKAAKELAKKTAIEEMAKVRKQRREARAQSKLPEFKAVRAKRRSFDDFGLGTNLDEDIPDEVEEIDIAQRGAKNRNFTPGLTKKDKAAKIAGWTLFGAIHYLGKPLKWIGGGVVKGVNFALRWGKKKINGPNSTQKTSKVATQEKQDQFSREIEGVKSGKDNQEIMADTSRVPMNWAMETAEDPDKEPTVTVGANAETDANNTDFVNSGHAWMRLGFTKWDPASGRNIRNTIDVGYGPRGGFALNGFKGGAQNGADQVATGALMPGALWDERGKSFAAAKTYKATNRQINQMLIEAERYPAGGFNVVTRNCARFLADVTQNAGINTSDILQKAPIRLGAKYLAVPLVSLLAPATKMISDINGVSKSGQDDLSYQRLGEKQITEDEMDLMQKDNGVKTEGYTPLNLVQSIKNQGEDMTALHNTSNPTALIGESDKRIEESGAKLKTAIQNSLGKQAADAFVGIMSQLRNHFTRFIKVRYAATPEQIVHFQKNFSGMIDLTSKFFYQVCQGKPEFRMLFLNYIGDLNRAKMVYDVAFREARRREDRKRFEQSDISLQLMELTHGGTRQYSLKTEKGEQEITSSPSLMIGYARRGSSVEQTAELKNRNQNKKELLNALDKSVNADAQKLWAKESYSDEDVDLAFGTLQNQEEGIVHNKMDYEKNFDFTGAEVMQAMIFERIYGGLKGRISSGGWFVEPKNEQGQVDDKIYNSRSKDFVAWLKQDLEISAISHPAEVAQIENSISKRLGLQDAEQDPNSKDSIKKEYQKRLFTNYLVPLLVQVIIKKFGKDQYFSVYGMLQKEFGIE